MSVLLVDCSVVVWEVISLGLGAVLHRPLPYGSRPWFRFLIVPAVILLFIVTAQAALEKSAANPDLLAENARRLASDGKKEEALAMFEKALA